MNTLNNIFMNLIFTLKRFIIILNIQEQLNLLFKDNTSHFTLKELVGVKTYNSYDFDDIVYYKNRIFI